MGTLFRPAGHVAVTLLAPALLVSCGSVDPVLQDEIDQVWNRAPTAQVFPHRQPVRWKAGQWVRLRIDDSGVPGVRTVSLAKKEGSAYWLEVHDVRPESDTRAIARVEDYRPETLREIKVTQIKVQRPGGEVVNLADEEADVCDAEDIRASLEEMLDAVRLGGRRGNIEDVAVPAGTFRGALARSIFARRAEDDWQGFVWYTGAVPILGYAKVEARRGSWLFFTRQKTIEVDAFGDQGVKSAFFD